MARFIMIFLVFRRRTIQAHVNATHDIKQQANEHLLLMLLLDTLQQGGNLLEIHAVLFEFLHRCVSFSRPLNESLVDVRVHRAQLSTVLSR